MLVTQDFLPSQSGASRRHVALARRYPEPMSVSTVAFRDAARHDAAEDYAIERQPFEICDAATLINQFRWKRWLAQRCKGRVQVLHCGDVTVVGQCVWKTHKRLRIPYIVYLSAGELCRAQEKSTSALGRRAVRLVLGDAAGVVTTTEDVATLTREMMDGFGISSPPPVSAVGLGTDPSVFTPGRDSGTLRQRWGVRRFPIILTVAKLVPHKGQDTGIEALSLLRDEFPDLRYVLVGEGSDEPRLRNLAADFNVMDRVGFAGAMRDDELPEAYATSTIYLDASRVAPNTAIEGHGIALVEAAATGLAIVASDLGSSRSMVQGAGSGLVLDATNARTVADSIAGLLRDPQLRAEMAVAGRESVETHLNWNRVANDTARFVRECVSNG